MGFQGIIVSDSMAIQGTSPETYEEQVISAVNCGMDMLMEGERYDETRQIIINAVTNGRILLERIDDAATRIIRVKKNVGLFEDPFCINMTAGSEEPGSMKHRAVAEQLVEKSLVLLKNENRILPLKKGTKVYITGPSADDPRAQCGGWTMGWNASPTKDIPGVTTILEAFVRYADTYDIEVITDPSQAETADVVLLCVGEQAYAEWFGDTYDLSLCGKKGLGGNRRAMDAVKSLGKPTVTCIIAGRHVLIEKDDYNQWDSLVMCYLPGSEGKGISDVLCGCSDFSGRLPEPWYESVNQIGQDECWFEIGYGMSYQDGFVPVKEPEAVPDAE
jgi:beta-glucosidase